MDLEKENLVCKEVIGAAIEVHRELGGPGLLESVYEEALVSELKLRGLSIESQKEVPIIYKGKKLQKPLRLDLLIEGLVIAEVKAVAEMNPVFKAQALTYLRLSNLKIGLVINFGQAKLVDGVNRVINNQFSL